MISAIGSVFLKSMGDIGAESPRHLETFRNAIDHDDPRRSPELRARGGAKADRALGEHDNAVADLDATAFRPAKACAHDVGAHQHLLVAEPVRHEGEVRHGVRHHGVLGLATVDRVAEAPATHGLPSALRLMPV